MKNNDRQNQGMNDTSAAAKKAADAHVLYLFVKRFTDILCSFAASVILIVPVMILCVIIMVMDFGSPFYIQKRVAKNGGELPMAKLRSMKKGAEDIEHTLNAAQLAEYRKEYKLADDPRLLGWDGTGDGSRCFGAFLRRMSLDEVPQIFWNVLIRGDMSLVGPRPILREELEKNYTPEEQKILLSIKPGLTGYWQAYARNNATYATGERQRMELFYVQNRGIWLDMKIFFATFGAVFSKKGAY